jgi:hypothetical protein
MPVNSALGVILYEYIDILETLATVRTVEKLQKSFQLLTDGAN